MGISKLDADAQLLQTIKKGSQTQQFQYVNHIATEVVKKCTPLEQAYTDDDVDDLGDHVYNYARVLCHFGTLVLEFTDT